MTRRHNVTPARTLRDFSPHEVLCFLSAWRPVAQGCGSMGRWATWAEYLDDYQAVRAELRERFADRLQYLTGGEPFGDRALRFAEAHGMAALEAADFVTVQGTEAAR